MKIGEFARIAHCTPDTIRFYEKEGLLPQARRTESNYRVYDESHVERLRLIRNCRLFDMTHEEVRAILQAADAHCTNCDAVDSLIDAHIGHITARIDELVRLRARLSAMREKCGGTRSVDACAIMQELSSRDTHEPSAKKTHLG